MSKSVIKEAEKIIKKYGEIYPESFNILATTERINIIEAYYAGAMAQLKNNVNVDEYLNQYYATTTLPAGDSICNS